MQGTFIRTLSLLVSISTIVLYLSSATAQEVFFGNLHSHTSYSDGVGTPDDAFQHARNTARMDFLAVTEHNHAKAEMGAGDRQDGILIATNTELYTGPNPRGLIPAAERWTENGKFVALYGQEYSTISSGNHINVFDVPVVIDVPNGEFKKLLTWLDTNRDSTGDVPLIQFNHPGLFPNVAKEYGRHNFASVAEWVAALDPHVKLIEVLNGPAMTRVSGQRSSEVQEKDFFEYLNLGFHLAPSAGQDNHYATWGTATDSRIALVADSLTKQNILTALKNRRAYATEDKNLRVIFKVNGHLLGEIISEVPELESELDIQVSLRDDDEPDAHYRVEVYSDVPGGQLPAGPVKVFELEGDTPVPVKLDGIRYKQPGQYVLLKIIQTSEHGPPDRVWTAPVWFEPGSARPPAVLGDVRIVELIPNPAGPEDENESVTLENAGNDPVSLAGWSLRDLSGKKWNLDSLEIINAGERKTARRNRQPMSLGNSGDTIELLNASGRPVQTVSYGRTAPEQVIRP